MAFNVGVGVLGKRWFKHSKWPRILVWVHSYTIISFVLLLCSGIALVDPSVHTVLIPVLPFIYQIHILLGLVFAVTLLTPFVRLIPKGKAIRRLDWLLPMSLGAIIVFTGVLIWLVTVFPTAWRSTGSVWHGRISYLLGVWVLIHAFYKAWGYRPSNAGLNAKVQPERRMFLRWIGGGIAGGFVLSIIDPARLVNGLIQTPTNSSRRGTTITAPPHFAEYYTVTGKYPPMDLQQYHLTVDGLVRTPVVLKWSDIEKLPTVTQSANFCCVTGWSVADVQWTGLRLQTLAQHLHPSPKVKYVNFYSFDGSYTESLRLNEAYDPSVLLAYKLSDQPLRPEQGFPVRLVVPKMYGYKSIKWVSRVEFTDKPLDGYWEQRGYSTEAYVNTVL